MTWHANDVLLARYAHGELDATRAASVEAHLLACDSCRAAVAAGADRARLDRVWRQITSELDAPQPGPVERLLCRLRIPGHVARLLAATPSLRLSWLGAVALALGFAVLGAHAGPRGLLVFLALAPLLPVAGVAAAYGPGIDPTYEVSLAAPMRGFQLLLLRAVAVLASSIVLAGVAALALPSVGRLAAAWLLPALALTLASLALATIVTPLHAAGAVAFVWVAAVTVTARLSLAGLGPHVVGGSGVDEWPRLVLFDQAGQLAFALLVVVAAVMVVRRRERFDLVDGQA